MAVNPFEAGGWWLEGTRPLFPLYTAYTVETLTLSALCLGAGAALAWVTLRPRPGVGCRRNDPPAPLTVSTVLDKAYLTPAENGGRLTGDRRPASGGTGLLLGRLAASSALAALRGTTRRAHAFELAGLAATLLLAAWTTDAGRAAGTTLTVYSGRQEVLVGPLMDLFAKKSGVNLRIRYGDSAELAVVILEEGREAGGHLLLPGCRGAGGPGPARPADHAAQGLLQRVSERFRVPDRQVGGDDRPGPRRGLQHPGPQGDGGSRNSTRGLPIPGGGGASAGPHPTPRSRRSSPPSGSPPGKPARSWIEGIKANLPKSYANNLAAAARRRPGRSPGRVRQPLLPAPRSRPTRAKIPRGQSYHPRDAGVGAMINVAGTAILTASLTRTARTPSSTTCSARRRSATSPSTSSSTRWWPGPRPPAGPLPWRRSGRRTSTSATWRISRARWRSCARPASSNQDQGENSMPASLAEPVGPILHWHGHRRSQSPAPPEWLPLGDVAQPGTLIPVYSLRPRPRPRGPARP